MSDDRPRGWARAALAISACAVAVPVSCSAPGKGALILSITTDMQTPKDLDILSVYIETDSVPKLDYLGRVLPDGTVTLPSTIAVVEPDKQGAQVRIRVIAFQEQKARVMRDVLTTVPHQRTALLRLPLSYLDDGSVTGTLPAQYLPIGPKTPSGPPEGETQFQPTDPDPTSPEYMKPACDFTQQMTSVAGTCKSAVFDSSMLPDYSDSQVFGAGGSALSPVCFDVSKCLSMAAAQPISNITMAPDGSCSFPLAAGENGDHWNCALETTDGTGTCVGGRCFVPLETDPGEGFTIQPGKAIVMVPGVCNLLKKGATLFIDRASCATKNESAPVCEPNQETGGGGDAGADASSCGTGSQDGCGAAQDAGDGLRCVNESEAGTGNGCFCDDSARQDPSLANNGTCGAAQFGPNAICCAAPTWPSSGECVCDSWGCSMSGGSCSCGPNAVPGSPTSCPPGDAGSYCCRDTTSSSLKSGCSCFYGGLAPDGAAPPCPQGTTPTASCDLSQIPASDLLADCAAPGGANAGSWVRATVCR